MADPGKSKSGPDLKTKLTAPSKKSLFEKQKAEAEAKRLREEAETAAVYEDFVKSFDDTSENANSSYQASRFDGGPPRRHFASGPQASRGGHGIGSSKGGFPTKGPGSLGPPPPSLLSRKRAYDGSQPQRDRGILAFENSASLPLDPITGFQASDDEEDQTHGGKLAERAAPKPTLRLSSLPPGTSPAVIKALVAPFIGVDGVRIVQPTGDSLERKSLSAIVTLAKDTPANEIDTAVNGLQNRYLGWGFYLSLSRHLSSAALQSVGILSTGLGSSKSLPFGAKAISQAGGGVPMGHGPMGHGMQSNIHRGGFAPPTSYAPSGPGQHVRGPPQTQVPVSPPSDLKQLKMIHMTLESLLTYGPEFEALLMSRPDVQREERWAWIWDPRSVGGVWYRWRLWQLLSGAKTSSGYSKNSRLAEPQRVFEGGAPWAPSSKGLRFEYITKIDEFVSDSEYDSSEDEDFGDNDRGNRGRQQSNFRGAPPPSIESSSLVGEDKAGSYLNPLLRAKLTHLLARQPSSIARLRKGDVARVTAFAIQHAGEGADEVVNIIVSNIEHPFSYTSANQDRKTNSTAEKSSHDIPTDDNSQDETSDKEIPISSTKDKEDMSSSKLISLYIVSDILSSSSTSGVRHAWRYRQLFESALKKRQIFENLGRLEKELHWGRLRAEKWRRSVGSVLQLWEGWCVFPQPVHEHFVNVFREPPPTPEELLAVANSAELGRGFSAGAAKSKWKSVAASASKETSEPGEDEELDGDDADGEPMAEDDSSIDGEAMDDIDGEPIASSGEGEAMDEDEPVVEAQESVVIEAEKASAANGDAEGVKGADPLLQLLKGSEGLPPRRKRPKAQDMFADSDEE
ncbi:MAG: hypothetical protein M1829_000270 [Trizodia sp. TS-e1964]|nr:MAG: hypothetical protein M1829_000270 [Trizodia sp. TS-e1964]